MKNMNVIAIVTIALQMTTSNLSATPYEDAVTIPMTATNWFVKMDGAWEMTTEGVQAYGCGYRRGNDIISKQLYDFRDSHTFMKFRVDGGNGAYSRFFVWLNNIARVRRMSTHHTYEGSRLVSPGVWYFVHYHVEADGSYTAVSSTGDYDVNGGTVLDTTTGNWATDNSRPDFSGYVQQGQIVFRFDDTYGGTAAFIVAAETRTTAQPLTLLESEIYTFDDGIFPEVFSASSGVSIVDRDGGGKCVFIPDQTGEVLSVGAEDVVAIGHDILGDYYGSNHGSSSVSLYVNDLQYHRLGTSDGQVDNWIRQEVLSIPEIEADNTIEWKAYRGSDGGNGTYLDNIVLYRLSTEPVIESFHGNGELTWTHSTTSGYHMVEWASSPTGTWHHAWTNLINLPANGETTTVNVPMFYRVVWSTNQVAQ
jgi:hypothetical protein